MLVYKDKKVDRKEAAHSSAKQESQKQWNTNPCGALPGLNYDKLYFDQVESERYRQQYWQKGFFDYRSFRQGRVLEIGIGLGTDLKQFARNGSDCYGVDITDRHLELTQKNFELEGFKVKLSKTDATRLPFPDNYFDCVYSFGVLHHIPEIAAVLNEARRVLKPGGIIQVSMYHLYSIHTLTLFLRTILNGSFFRLGIAGMLSKVELGADGVEIKPYVKLYTRRTLVQTISAAGFQSIKTEVHQVNFDKSKWMNIFRRFERHLGWYVCNQSRKPF